jgi:hypothetical protein
VPGGSVASYFGDTRSGTMLWLIDAVKYNALF